LKKLQNLKKIFYSALTCTFLFNLNIPVNSTEKEVKVYSGRHYNTDRSVFKKFAEETGIRVRLIEAAGISLIERLKREGENSQADLILLVDAARITNAAKSGLLQKINSNSLENDVPIGLKDPNKEWYALTRRVRVMVANPKVVDVSKINDYTDLADPSLKGKVCLRNRKSPYNQSLVANQIINKGEEVTKNWLNGMISNVSQPFFPGDISIVRAVSKRKCGVGIVNHYYVARMLAGVNGRRDALYAKKTTVLTPNPAHVNISAGGVAKFATNKNEAIKLLEYLASPKGSKGLAAPTFEHPLKEVNQNPIVKEFGDFVPDKVSIEDLGVKNSIAIKLMKDAGWD
jgi:iron(III) transport system substrate-binding protein